MAARRQLLTVDDAKPAKGQHKKPCSDCPFVRTAVNGWLGDMSIEQWISCVVGESRLECHTLLGAQCAGAAIFRSNIAKRPRDRSLLLLPQNRTLVFSTPGEFQTHHMMVPRSRSAVLTAFEEVRDKLDEASAPSKLTKAQYKELLGDLIADLESRLECVRIELEEDG